MCCGLFILLKVTCESCNSPPIDNHCLHLGIMKVLVVMDQWIYSIPSTCYEHSCKKNDKQLANSN